VFECKFKAVLITPHHIGCIVADIDEAATEHRLLHSGTISEKYFVSSQNVWVCFAELTPGFYIEFVQPAGEGSAVSVLKKKNITYYHLGYKTDNISKEIAALEKAGYKLLIRFSSEAFAGKECAFLFGSDARLLELIEA
jgi:hypothetical protein